MLREIKTKEGRAHVIPFLGILARLKLANDETAHFAMLSIVFSERWIKKKT